MTRLDEEFRGDVPIWNRLSYSIRRRVRTAVLYSFLALSVLYIIVPLGWLFYSSIRTMQSLRAVPLPLISFDLTLEHYHVLIYSSEFLSWLQNSIIVSVGVVTLTTTLATLGGYGLTRLNFSHKKTFARGILFGYMFPAILLSIPMFIFWTELGIINSYIGLVLAQTALALPFSLWLMWKFFQTVPYSLEESAYVAGASRFRGLVDIALPLATPGIIAVAIFAFAVSWNEYTMARILMPDREMYVLTVGLETFLDSTAVQWGPLMAGSFLTIVPAFVFVYFLQKYLIQGMAVGGH